MSLEMVITAGVAHVSLDRPPVNALDIEAIERLRDVFASLAADPPAIGVVLSGAGRCFCAGVDTRAFSATGATIAHA
jgi:enoyl-CoA hydratase/carnithine racemase